MSKIEKFDTLKRVSNCTSIFTEEIYGILELMKYIVNVTEENILLAINFKSSIQEIRKLNHDN